MKAEELAEKLENRSRFGYETQEQANKRHILACKAAAAELRRLAALEKEGNDDLTIAYLSGHSKGAADTKAKLEQAAEQKPFGMYVEYSDGTTLFRKTGQPFPATALGGTAWQLFAEPTPAPRKPMTREDMRKLLAEHFDHEELTGADFSLIRAVERFHKIEE
jgi:hypothetical protein